MALVQVRDVPDDTVARLKALAKQKGITMAAFIREELERLAERPTQQEVWDRIVRERPAIPTTSEETVAIIRALREGTS